VHEELSNWVLNEVMWRAPQKPEIPRMVFDLSKVGAAQFWHDKHYTGGTFVSDAAKSQIEAAKITGVHFNHREQA
jgi:hypothetical protein